MAQTLDIELAGTTVTLDADRALFWPQESTLVVADLHLGKGGVFRRAGVPVPTGDTRADLERVSGVIARHRAQRVVLLGDVVHGSLASDGATLDAVASFVAAHSAVEIVAVRGNHDRASAVQELATILRWVPSMTAGPFEMRHEPTPDARIPPGAYHLAGHLHPVARLKTRLDRVRVPVFWFRRLQGVLPSFGAFTGGWELRPDATHRLYAAMGAGLAPLSHA